MIKLNDSGFSIYELSVSIVITGIVLGSLYWGFMQVQKIGQAWQKKVITDQELLIGYEALKDSFEKSYSITYNSTFRSFETESIQLNKKINLFPDFTINSITFKRIKIEAITIDSITRKDFVQLSFSLSQDSLNSNGNRNLFYLIPKNKFYVEN